MTEAITLTKPESLDDKTSHFAAEVVIDASPDAVFDALTTRHGISGWWGPVKGDPTAGGEFTFRPMINIEKLFRVDSAERASTVQWTVLECEFLPEWPGTTIHYDLSPAADGGTRIEFKHVGLTPQLECWDLCDSGWQRSLASLVAYLETGQGTPF